MVILRSLAAYGQASISVSKSRVPAELEYVRRGGADARRELAARLAASPSGHRADLNRPSLEGKD